MKHIWISIVISILSIQAFAQGQPDSAPPQRSSSCYAVGERSAIADAARRYMIATSGEARSYLPTVLSQSAQQYAWPVAQLGDKYECVYMITYYMDNDPTFGNSINYACESNNVRDGHTGTDIQLFPFPRHMMDENAGVVLAAASGILIHRVDTVTAESCVYNNRRYGNHVAVLHPDGLITVYAHLKPLSVTSAPLGSFVYQGQKLGMVGSTGNSTGPHLHFEVMDIDSVPYDPFAGSCASSSSMWADQKPYPDAGLNHITVGKVAADFDPPCPEREEPHDGDSFRSGTTLHFTAYFRHIAAELGVVERMITDPDGDIMYNDVLGSLVPDAGVMLSLPYDVPVLADLGEWRFTCTYGGTMISRPFQITEFDCSDARSIACGQTLSGDFINGTQQLVNYPAPYFYNGLIGREDIYAYHTDLNWDNIAINVQAPLCCVPICVSVFSECSMDGLEAAGYAPFCSDDCDQEVIFQVPHAGTYYIVLDGMWSDAPYDITVRSSQCGGYQPGPFELTASASCVEDCGLPWVSCSWTPSAAATRYSLPNGPWLDASVLADTLYDLALSDEPTAISVIAENEFAATMSNVVELTTPCDYVEFLWPVTEVTTTMSSSCAYEMSGGGYGYKVVILLYGSPALETLNTWNVNAALWMNGSLLDAEVDWYYEDYYSPGRLTILLGDAVTVGDEISLKLSVEGNCQWLHHVVDDDPCDPLYTVAQHGLKAEPGFVVQLLEDRTYMVSLNAHARAMSWPSPSIPLTLRNLQGQVLRYGNLHIAQAHSRFDLQGLARGCYVVEGGVEGRKLYARIVY